MPTDEQTLCVYFLAARSAASDLRIWVLKRYFLRESQLDSSMTTTLRQLDHVTRSETFYGYSISQAPASLRSPIQHYIRKLWDGQKADSGLAFPKRILDQHKRIIQITEAAHQHNRGAFDA
ncbi:hypothetical protein [Acetobacter sp. LMG 32666]|uniref:hypothetical protein n=1 Tax=Acetobacter sp. LMG 32666 TaxID=2959295 RepID=UPI0030C7ABF8